MNEEAQEAPTSPDMPEYEKQRNEIIAKNKEKMRQLVSNLNGFPPLAALIGLYYKHASFKQEFSSSSGDKSPLPPAIVVSNE